MKKLYYTIFTLIFLTSCKPPEIGYLSDDIHALEDTIFVPRGIFKTSAVPAIEGSTYPLHWEITGVNDINGNPTEDLFDEHEILIWKEPFNPVTDTTLELVEAKLELSNKPTLLINDVSGELAFTQTSKHITGSDIYNVNVNASNVRGERQLDDFVTVKFEPFKPVEFRVEMRSRLNLVKNEGGGLSALFTSTIRNDNDPGVPSVLDGTHPYITIQKISDEPKLGIKTKMIIADSYGVPIGPDKVTFYPYQANYLQNYHDNSIKTTEDATGTIFELPAPPFPQYARNFGGSTNGYLMYYLTTRDAFTVDTAAYEADNGPKDWAPFTNASGEIVNQAYIRWGVRINDSGTWEMKMRIPYTIKK
ncbi:DUF5007 domain-containing protein [Tamlana sp. 2201CG12-4]|uniref:DUF5007 domain-containing protein n=1 Tax=Tamlana sp. 2201CG12-4 TaxID=3112582 RepID=UPI002DB5DE9A|nr:DUF5007 domain-containing protein [Tamlana sp. 2201CG12-4]MEC3908878.1 DUF5007 domain-containing protein [Tamlana sp. 2201CG12-4]